MGLIVKWSSIRARLILFLLTATILPIVATMLVTYFYTAQSLRDRVAGEDSKLLYQGARNLSSLLDDLNRSSSNVYSILTLLQGGYDDAQSGSQVYSVLSYITASVPDIFQVYLYETRSRKATLVTLNTPQRNYNTDAYPDALEENKGIIWTQKSHMSHTYGLTGLQPKYPSESVFTMHRRIERVPSSEVVGYLSIDVKMSALTDIVDQLYERNRETIYIVDDNGDLIYTDDTTRLGQPLQEAWYTGRIAVEGADRGHFEQEGSMLVYQQLPMREARWTLIKQVPVAYLVREANRAVAINLLLLAISLIVIAAATILISVRITAPIKQLLRYMNQIQSGNLNVDIKPVGQDEMGIVTLRFRSMMDTINNLILREYKLELANQSNQLRAMQAQINPHFLNNTLQIIGTLALELKVPRIYALLSSLANMMRYSMHNTDKTVTLQEELNHARAYIELQKERFEDRFRFHCEVEEQLLSLLMPKMVLQPILENYFKYGIDRNGENGELTVTAKSVAGTGLVHLTVQNNGASIAKERLEQLHQELASWSASGVNPPVDPQRNLHGSSIGLVNVLQRLKLFSGESSSLVISNSEPTGVRIVVTIARAGPDTVTQVGSAEAAASWPNKNESGE